MDGIKVINWFSIFVLFIVPNMQSQSIKNIERVCGTYVCSYKIPHWGKTQEFLLLFDNHTYAFYRAHPVPYGVGVCRSDCYSVCGTWKLQTKYILFETFDMDSFVKIENCQNLSKDSVYIKVLKASDRTPHQKYRVICSINDTLIYLQTDSNGIFAIKKDFDFFSSSIEEAPFKTCFSNQYSFEPGVTYVVYEMDCVCVPLSSDSCNLQKRCRQSLLHSLSVLLPAAYGSYRKPADRFSLLFCRRSPYGD